ncbi:MAG: hypothetical protein KKD01_12330 [Proteobacteria bacterium]|nr:hypothetical protein [Pseudomonadota bacterium]MBU1234668.1 hypothetical protein [Pseudomonadota bacterium]MBU1416847.1 hypothetical protein [Pseudomonadota bacterium]MBU1455507.1 hypothetical protein [Pseudomonadota bacterium]
MSVDDNLITCDQCGQEVAASELIFDEETAMLLCPPCFLEGESCGCSDEGE